MSNINVYVIKFYYVHIFSRRYVLGKVKREFLALKMIFMFCRWILRQRLTWQEEADDIKCFVDNFYLYYPYISHIRRNFWLEGHNPRCHVEQFWNGSVEVPPSFSLTCSYYSLLFPFPENIRSNTLYMPMPKKFLFEFLPKRTPANDWSKWPIIKSQNRQTEEWWWLKSCYE